MWSLWVSSNLGDATRAHPPVHPLIPCSATHCADLRVSMDPCPRVAGTLSNPLRQIPSVIQDLAMNQPIAVEGMPG